MPKTFPLDVKERALELYLQGHSSKDIAESLRTEFSNDVTQSTVCLLYTSPSPRD